MDETFTLACPDCQELRDFRVPSVLGCRPPVGGTTSAPDGQLVTCSECRLGLTFCVVSTDDTGTVVRTRPRQAPILRHQTAGLPETMANDLLEAGRCYSFMAYRGAGLLARRAVEQAVVMLGVPPTKKTLQQKLDWLLNEGHLPNRCRSDTRTIRDVGNAAAHGAGAVSSEEAHAGVRAALAVVTVLLGGAPG